MQHLWEPKRRIELAFRRSLMELARRMIRRVGHTSDPDKIRKTLLQIAETRTFQRVCQAAAMKMVTGLFDDQGRTWRQAATRNGRSRELYTLLRRELQGPTGRKLRDLVAENAALIRTLPTDIASDVAAYTSREAMKGRRASDIAEEIRTMFPAHTRARAELIARTQTSMAQTELTQARCQNFGIHWYIWRPVGGMGGDGRTRTSHRMMSGVIVNWDDPPAPEDLFPTIGKNGKPYRNSLGHYHAGCCPNCRCYPEPIIDLDLVNWPARIYRHGSIRTISRRNFERIQ